MTEVRTNVAKRLAAGRLATGRLAAGRLVAGRLAALVLAVAGHPRLWPVAAAEVRRTARPRWWAAPPYLPLPSPEYLAFRMVTAYGAEEPWAALSSGALAPADLADWLQWCRYQR
ncbi:MAG: hypothetical protein ACYDH5_10090 [Acidimicrobiales bacterium]